MGVTSSEISAPEASAAFIESVTCGLEGSAAIRFTISACIVNSTELMHPVATSGGVTPLYSAPRPSFVTVSVRQCSGPRNRPPFPSLCSRTLIVSNGCPAITRLAPLQYPAMNSRSFSFIQYPPSPLIVCQKQARNNGTGRNKEVACVYSKTISPLLLYFFLSLS